MILNMLMMIGGALMMLQPLFEQGLDPEHQKTPALIRLMRLLSDAFVAETSTPQELEELVNKIK